MKPLPGTLFLFLALLPGILPAAPVTSLVAQKGDLIADGAALNVAGPAAIDSAGEVVAKVSVSGTGFGSGEKTGIVLFSGSTTQIIAKVGDIDPVTGRAFTKLSDPVMSGSGAIAFIGSVKQQGRGNRGNDPGVYVYDQTKAVLSRVAALGQSVVTGSSTPTALTAIDQITVNNAGGVSILGKTSSGFGPAFFATDSSGTLRLLGSKRDELTRLAPAARPFQPLPFVSGQSRSVDTVAGNVAFLRKEDARRQAVVKALSGTAGFSQSKEFSVGDSIYQAPPIVNFFSPPEKVVAKALGQPAVNARGDTAFKLLLSGSSVTGENNQAIVHFTEYVVWICYLNPPNDGQFHLLDSGTQGGGGYLIGTNTGPEFIPFWLPRIVARTGDCPLSSTGDRGSFVFESLSDPVMNNLGQIAFRGVLKSGGTTGVTSSNKIGIWTESRLLIRAGDVAPGTNGATFCDFLQLVFPDANGPIFLATLNGVPASENTGVWAATKDGTLTLVVKTGELLDGKTVQSLSIFPLAQGSIGQSRSFDASSGKIVYQANFTDGSWGIYKVDWK